MMGDACICIDVECEDYVDWGEEKVTAETDHKCTECNRTIPAGVPHVLHTGQEYDDKAEDECGGGYPLEISYEESEP